MQLDNKRKDTLKGFTLIEILLVIGIIAILAAVVIVAINPGRQLSQANNTQRRSNVNTILNAVYQHAIDNSGSLPSGIPTASTCANLATHEICKAGGAVVATCTGLVDLSVVATAERYLVSLPMDPAGGYNVANGTGYTIVKSSNNRVTVCATRAEVGETISVTR